MVNYCSGVYLFGEFYCWLVVCSVVISLFLCRNCVFNILVICLVCFCVVIFVNNGIIFVSDKMLDCCVVGKW